MSFPSARQRLIDRYKSPAYRGALDPTDVSHEADNPLCGDRVRIDLLIGDDERVLDARFDGRGCSVSQATADLLVEYTIGKQVNELREMTPEALIALLGVDLGLVRLKCALLPLHVLQHALEGWELSLPHSKQTKE